MLELRPNCELCDRDLPPTAADARICSYECTYCANCVDTILHNVCPTCGGGFAPRPVRPLREWREGSGLGLINHPASDRRRHTKWKPDEILALVERLKATAPENR